MCIEVSIGSEQLLEGVAAIQGEFLPVGEQHITVALDVVVRSLPESQRYSLRRISPSTSARRRMTWNLSKMMRVMGILRMTVLRNGIREEPSMQDVDRSSFAANQHFAVHVKYEMPRSNKQPH